MKIKKIWKNHWKEILIFTIVGILISFLPWLFVQNLTSVSFIDTGDIGDTIGGITAPFLSFFAAILVYLALRAQIEANKKIQYQFDIQQFESKFYKMLDLHRSNIIEMEVSFFDHLTGESFKRNSTNPKKFISCEEFTSTDTIRSVSGRKLFVGMIVELEAIIKIVIQCYEEDSQIKINKESEKYFSLLEYSYSIFFFRN